MAKTVVCKENDKRECEMARIFSAPSRYVQGYDELKNICTYIQPYGKTFMVITSKGRVDSMRGQLDAYIAGSGCRFVYEVTNGQSTMREIERLVEKTQGRNYDAVIGLGGGKCLDIAKAVSKFAELPLILVPTIASTDAPSSSYAVIYSDEGVFMETLYLKRNPDIVLVDSHLIAEAPARYFIAGVGDALATYYEAITCIEGYKTHFVGVAEAPRTNEYLLATATKASECIARACRDVLYRDGMAAKFAIEKHRVTKAVENVIEANCLLSSVGFESNGVTSAHAIYCGFTELARPHKLHGEYVAFGTIATLILENAPKEEIEKAIDFCIDMGLPVTFADLGLQDITQEELFTVAKVSADPAQTSANEPFEILAEEFLAAIVTADAWGSDRKRKRRPML